MSSREREEVPSDDPLLLQLGANIKVWRVARGLSQEGLAEFLGVHRTYASSLERGERNLSLKALQRLAKQLDVDPVDLLRSDGLAGHQD